MSKSGYNKRKYYANSNPNNKAILFPSESPLDNKSRGLFCLIQDILGK